MKTHPQHLVDRIKKQASYTGSVRPEQLLLEELLDMQRAYMLALEIILKESRNENRTGR